MRNALVARSKTAVAVRNVIETLEARTMLAFTAALPTQLANPSSSPYIAAYAQPQTGAVHTPMTSAQLTTALNTAQLGDRIILQAGVTYVGSFTLQNKTTGTGWISIESSALANLPAGVRVTPADAPDMPKIQSPGGNASVIYTAPGAHHYKFIGIEFIAPINGTDIVGLISLGDGSAAQDTVAELPHDLLFDRIYIHAHTATQKLRRGFAMNSGSTDVVNSWIADCRDQGGSDAQAIGGWNGSGPYNILNNHLEGAAENIMFGGADNHIPNVVPADIVIRNNHIMKPLAWRGVWVVKNLFELKTAHRVLMEGNLLENCWVSGQTGIAINLKTNLDSPWSSTQDITIVNNIIRHAAQGVTLQGLDYINNGGHLHRVVIKNNLFDDINGANWGGGSGWLIAPSNSPKDVEFSHNTAFNSGSIISNDSKVSPGFIIKDNIVNHSTYGIKGDSQGVGNTTINAYFPDSVITKNVMMGGNPNNYTSRPGNFFPPDWATVQFVDQANGNYRLKTTSPYHNVATDGKDLGVDFDALDAAMNGTGPLASPGGPYSVNEGSQISLNGTGSTGTGLTYQWDFNYNGSSFDVDATGTSPTFSAALIDGLVTRTIALRVTDSGNLTDIKSTTVTINNVNPTATLNAGAAVTQGSPSSVSFSGQADPAPADVSAGFVYSYDFNNDGDFTDSGDIANSSSSSASFTYGSSGSFNVRGRIADNDGGFTDYVKAVTVNPSGPATNVTLNPAADAYVRDGSSNNTNFGSTTILEVKKDATNYNREAFLKFDLTSLSGIVTAKVRVWGKLTNSGNGITIGLYPVSDNNWGEGTIRFNNKPNAGAAAFGTIVVSSTIGQYFEFDVSDYVRDQKLAGATHVSFDLKALSSGSGMPVFNSRENGSNKPQLQVSQSIATQGLVVSTSTLPVPEGGSNSFSVKLAAAPASNVTVNITKNGGGDGNLNSTVAALTFTSANWNTAQNVTISASQDGDAVNGSAVFTVSSSGLTSKTVTAIEADDEGAALQTLLASHDAYGRDGTYANSNFGNDTQLVVKKDAVNSNRESYIKFDIGSVSSISNAKLRLFGKLNDVYASGLVAAVFGGPAGTWNESTVTYNTRPATSTGQLASATVLGTTGAWYEFDVTSFLQAQKTAGATSVTFVVRAITSGPTLMTFNSGEASSNGPQLVVSA